MNYWQYIINVIPKWLLFALESYILFVSATILFPIIFDIQFTLPLYTIWLSFLIINLITSVSKSKSKILLYFCLVVLFILSFWYWDKSLLTALSVLLVFYWRYSIVEEIYDLTLASFLNRIKVYIAITGLFFIFALFVDYQITNNWVIYSYLKVLIIYLISGSTLQLSDSVNNKELRRSLFIQTIFLLGGFSLILIIFYLTMDYIYKFFSFIKKSVAFIQISIGQILERLLNSLFINKGLRIEINNDKDIINQHEDSLFLSPDNYVYSNKFWDYFETGLLLLAIVIIVLLIIRLIRRSNSLKAKNYIKTNRNYLENITDDKSYKIRKRRFISSNLYRRNYQKLLLWLIKAKIVKFDESYTSSEIKNIILAKYPHLTNEVEQITIAYQQTRYSNSEPDVSLSEFRNIIKKLKEKLGN